MRETLVLKNGWYFRKDESAAQTALPQEWEAVELPHTWNAVDGTDGGNDYFRGKCCYAKRIVKEELPAAEKYMLEICGANSSADVYVDGKALAHHDGGYSTWRVDVTAALQAESILSIVVDNAENNTVYPLPNSVGICLCVRTKDNKLIFAVRSAESGYRPGESDVSVVEGLNPQYDMKLHSLDLSSACYRAVYEEIGNIEEEKVEISVLGLVFDKAYNQWNFIGDVYINMTQDELIARRNSGASGKWELKALDFVRFHPKDIFQYLSTHQMWNMGIVTVYFTLVYNGFSKVSLDKYIKQYLK